MSLDRATPRAQVTSLLPFEGKVRIAVKTDAILRWRPSYCSPGSIRIETAGKHPAAETQGPFLSFGKLPAGTVIELVFPLPNRRESIVIGNPGFQQYRFAVNWRGETVMEITPDPANPRDAFTKLMGKRVTSFYHRQGPGPLYQRQTWSERLAVRLASSIAAPTKVDWYKL